MTSLLFRFALVGALVASAACSSSNDRASDGAEPSALTDRSIVSLRYTKLTDSGWVAVIEMERRFFETDVRVAYDPGTGTWIENTGRFVSDLGGGRELWIVDQLPVVEPLRFAVHYRAITSGGLAANAWDNNEARNYSASRGAAALGEGIDVAVTDASVAQDTLNASLLVRNLAYEKHVDLVYSTDGWATPKIASARFVDGNGARDGGETWTVDAPLDADATRVAFAARVRQDGREAWDNGDGKNFECTKNASGAWWCAGATLPPP